MPPSLFSLSTPPSTTTLSYGRADVVRQPFDVCSWTDFFFCFFLVLFLYAAKNVFGNPSSSSPEPEKGKHTKPFLANAAKERGREMKMGAGIIFSQISHFFSRFVTSFSLKREEEETKEHLVRKSGKASVVVVGEEKKEKCAYG